MGKLKFATNFGVEQETVELIHNTIFKISEDKIQGKLHKIPNDEFIDLYVYARYSLEAITHSENMHLNKSKIHEKVLEDYLFDHNYLEEQYGPKKEEMKTLDEQVEYEKFQEEKDQKKKLKQIEKKNKDMGYHAKADFNLSDKSDFPDLQGNTVKKTEATPENYREMIESTKNKPATYQKTINEMFPALGSDEPSSQPEKVSQPEKREKAWWEKINEKKV